MNGRERNGDRRTQAVFQNRFDNYDRKDVFFETCIMIENPHNTKITSKCDRYRSKYSINLFVCFELNFVLVLIAVFVLVGCSVLIITINRFFILKFNIFVCFSFLMKTNYWIEINTIGRSIHLTCIQSDIWKIRISFCKRFLHFSYVCIFQPMPKYPLRCFLRRYIIWNCLRFMH